MGQHDGARPGGDAGDRPRRIYGYVAAMNLDFNQPRLPQHRLLRPAGSHLARNRAEYVRRLHSFPLIARGRLVGAKIVGLQRDRLGRRPFSAAH